MREPSKRHSWSPRTTTTTTTTAITPNTVISATGAAPAKIIEPCLPAIPVIPAKVLEERVVDDNEQAQRQQQRPLQTALNGAKFTARSSVLAKVLVDTKSATRHVIEGGGGVTQVQYQPPPQRPQLPEAPPAVKNAKQRGFVCEVQPLIDDSKEEVDEELSDAGTYTLDGDNYTEEQKEMMDIDNLRRERQLMNKWDELMAAQEEEEERRAREDEAEVFLKCKRPVMQRPTSFEPSLEVSEGEEIG